MPDPTQRERGPVKRYWSHCALRQGSWQTNQIAVSRHVTLWAMAYERQDIVAAAEASAVRLGFDRLQDNQREAIISFLSDNYVVVLLPSSSGKSLCYSLLPLTVDCLRHSKTPSSIAMVVSLLVSLMPSSSSCNQPRVVRVSMVTLHASHSSGTIWSIAFYQTSSPLGGVWRARLLNMHAYTKQLVCIHISLYTNYQLVCNSIVSNTYNTYKNNNNYHL